MYVFVCKESIEGIFTGVYDAWASRYGHRNIRLTIDEPENYDLFCEYIEVIPNPEKSKKISRAVCNSFGWEVYQDICQAIMAADTSKGKAPDKADCVYRTILLGFAMHDGHKVLSALGEPYVARVFELSRATSREAHHLLGFLRFRQLKSGILFSTIHPRNNVLPILGNHFSDRLPQERFLIYDEVRQTAVLHTPGKPYILADASGIRQELSGEVSDEELQFQQLWCTFFDSVAIEARCNPRLQSQNIPKRFWQDTIELQRPQHVTRA